MNDIQKIASELLTTDQVQLIIGYEKVAEHKIRAAFIRTPKEAENLIFNGACIQNLAVYLTKKEVKLLSKIAIVASLPVMRSILQLARENQLSEKQVKVIGVSPDGKASLYSTFDEVENFVKQTGNQLEVKYQEAINKIKSLPLQERWTYWLAELEDCFKCYACRAACPLCYCTKCVVEINQPQWIPASSRPIANLEWHINRAMHMAGRCTQCDACANACPLGIPINLITRNMISDYEEAFGPVKEGIAAPNLLSTYNSTDKENFIR